MGEGQVSLRQSSVSSFLPERCLSLLQASRSLHCHLDPLQACVRHSTRLQRCLRHCTPDSRPHSTTPAAEVRCEVRSETSSACSLVLKVCAACRLTTQGSFKTPRRSTPC